MSRAAALVTLSQALSSSTNFFLVYFVSRVGSLTELAALSIALLVMGVGTNCVRSGLFRKAIVEKSGELASDAAWASQLVAMAASALLLLTAVVVPGSTGLVIVALGMPVLYAHDAARQRLLIAERFMWLVMVDLVWLATFGIGILVAPVGVTVAAVLWVSGAVAGLLCAGFFAVPLDSSRQRAWKRTVDARSELAEVAVLRGLPLLATLALAGLVDFQEFGAWSSLRSFYGPLTILYGTMSTGGLLLLAEMVRVAPRRVAYLTVALSVAFPLLAFLTATLLSQVVFPSDYGPAYEVAREYSRFVFPVAAFVAAAGVVQVQRSYAHARGMSPQRSLAVQIRASIVGIAFLVAGAPWGMLAAAWGGVAGGLGGAAIWVRATRALPSADARG